MIQFVFSINKQGKTRLAKWYSTYRAKEKRRIQREVFAAISSRGRRLCNFVDYRNMKIVYKRYAALYFICATDTGDNELLTLESLHLFVETLDRYFGNVCELDLIFNFQQAYYILDELFVSGHLSESSKQEVIKVIQEQDKIQVNEDDGNEKPITRVGIRHLMVESGLF